MVRISHRSLLVSTAAGLTIVVSTLGVGGVAACLDGHDGGVHDVPVDAPVELPPDVVVPQAVVPDVVVPDVLPLDVQVPTIEFPVIDVPATDVPAIETPLSDTPAIESPLEVARPSTPTPAETEGALASTGATTDRLVALGGALVAAGTAATALGRRRRTV